MSHTIDGSGNSANFPDVHAASDGRLIRYGIATRFSVPDKQRIIGSLIDVIRERANESVKSFGIEALTVISRDAGQEPNWQGADRLFVDDVIVEICALLIDVEDHEIVDTAINILCEQFADMIRTGGWCSSGRANRAVQAYMILRDLRDKV